MRRSSIRSIIFESLLIIVFVLFYPFVLEAQSQQLLWFGTVKIDDKILQGRYEIYEDSLIRRIVYAPYGLSPVEFKNIKQIHEELIFTWQLYETNYLCRLFKEESGYVGNCTSDSAKTIKLNIREFNYEDAILQGDSMHASLKDIQILDRALELLNNGNNWDQKDNRVCDNSSYPYKWSLYCALHQASIDIDFEYRHLRPALQAARQAINEESKGKGYAHLLQDFNNEAQDFNIIAKVLIRAKEIIIYKIQHKE